jgi:hypothetical protein
MVAPYGFYDLILEILKASDRAAFVFKGPDSASNGLF